MEVTLIRHTPEPDKVIALAARLCYSNTGIAGLEKGLSDLDIGRFIGKIVSLGHHSVLEHANFTFGIEGISRALSHQLVRHRLASYSQKSQRYVVEKEPFEYILPPEIGGREELAGEYRRLMGELHRAYSRLVEAGIPAEDARYVLPNAAETKIIVTMNARELRHFFNVRLCLRSQWEIRQMAGMMLGEARGAAPLVFTGAGPFCVEGPCPEGEMNCGKIAEVRKMYRESSIP